MQAKLIFIYAALLVVAFGSRLHASDQMYATDGSLSPALSKIADSAYDLLESLEALSSQGQDTAATSASHSAHPGNHRPYEPTAMEFW